MQTVTFANLKGGVGKTTLLILTARYLYATGARVLVVDSDLQRSATFYLSSDTDEIGTRSLASALANENAEDNIIPGHIHYIPSSLRLMGMRSQPPGAYRSLFAPLANRYDYLLIDTPAGYDNFILNAVVAADTVVVPVEFGQWPIHSTLSFLDQIAKELGETSHFDDKRFLCVPNRVRTSSKEGPNSLNQQYRDLLQHSLGPEVLAPVELRESAIIKRALDTLEPITQAKTKQATLKAIAQLCEAITAHPATVDNF